jgi:hypothetical protein
LCRERQDRHDQEAEKSAPHVDFDYTSASIPQVTQKKEQKIETGG